MSWLLQNVLFVYNVSYCCVLCNTVKRAVHNVYNVYFLCIMCCTVVCTFCV